MKNIQDSGSEQLAKKKALLTACIIAFGILLVIAACLLIFLEAKPVFFIPLFVFPITLMPVFISLKTINDELKSHRMKKSAGNEPVRIDNI